MITLKQFWLRLVKIVMPLILMLGVAISIIITLLGKKKTEENEREIENKIDDIKTRADLKLQKIDFELDCIEDQKEEIRKEVKQKEKLKEFIKELKL